MKDFKVHRHAAIQVGDIYFDPYNMDSAPHDAGIVFITHSHHDHFSFEDIRKVSNDDTWVIAPRECVEKLRGVFPDARLLTAVPGEEVNLPEGKGTFQAFYSYNENKWRAPGVPYHPRSADYLGYVLTVGGTRYLVCGDTDLTQELAAQKCDVLFVPIGGTYTMTASEAAGCANSLRPQIVVPMHYGDIVGSKADESAFLCALDPAIKCKLFV